MSLQTWFTRLASIEHPSDLLWHWGERGQIFVARIAMAMPRRDVRLTEREWDAVAWNTSYYGALIFWNPQICFDTRLVLLHALSDLIIQIGYETPTIHGGVYMFWDVLQPEADYDSLVDPVPAQAQHVELRQHLYGKLVSQLSHANRALQLGALHGLSHLGDERTPELVTSVQANLFDDEVRQFANSAARFELI